MSFSTRILLASLVCGLAGCPDLKAGGPSRVCKKAYEQCELPSGVLGVCDTVACAEGQAEPCLRCRSQH